MIGWFLLILLLVILLWWAWSNNKLEFFNTGIDLFKPLEECATNQNHLELPLVYDSENGVYRTRIHLGNKNGNKNEKSIEFSVVPDLGSSILIVAGPDCPECDRKDGFWDFSLGENISNGSQGTIRYGSQMTNYLPWQAYLLDYPGGKEVNFGVITRSKSNDDRPMNVMGLTNRINGFLDGLCGEKTVTFDFSNQKLYLGHHPIQNPKYVVPFVESSGPEFIMSELKDIKINGQSLNVVPKYAIWDTGATDTFMSPRLYNEFQKYSYPQTVELIFKNNISVKFKSEQHNISAANLPVADAMLIGNYWMRQYNFSIQHDNSNVIIF